MTRGSTLLRTRLLIPRRRTPPGASPGTLVADPAALAPVIEVMAYGRDDVQERTIDDVQELAGLSGRYPVMWVNVQGLGDVELIRRLGALFDIHQLALEDVINVHQRPKVEEYDDHVYIVCRMPSRKAGVHDEQVSMFLSEDWVITFQERPGDCFDQVRRRIRRAGAAVRLAGPDYLAYALLDAMTDAYFPLLEQYGETIEELEQKVLAGSGRGVTAGRIHDVKRELLSVRRGVWPLREVFNTLVREESPFVTDRSRVYFRDCYDHTIQLMDVIETYREIVSGLVDMHLSTISARMNEIMKVLTIIATIFIPLGFIAGVYGMNFETTASPWNMPELRWYYGYPFALGSMAAVAVGLMCYFWRRGWLGGPDEGSTTPGASARHGSPPGYE